MLIQYLKCTPGLLGTPPQKFPRIVLMAVIILIIIAVALICVQGVISHKKSFPDLAYPQTPLLGHMVDVISYNFPITKEVPYKHHNSEPLELMSY